MMKGTIIRLCMLIILFVFCLSIRGIALAACDNPDGPGTSPSPGAGGPGVPTSPGNAIAPPGWKDNKPIIVATYAPTTNADKETIDPTRPVILSVTGGCSPYTWSTSSTGYHLTDNEDGTKTLSVVSGTCGTDYDVFATVTVTSACGVPYTTQIRNTSGHWGNWVTEYFTGNCFSDTYSENIIGNRMYRTSYIILGSDCCNASKPNCDGVPTAWWWADYADNIDRYNCDALNNYTVVKSCFGACFACNNSGQEFRWCSLGYFEWIC
jgi:hypothetical protein